MINQITSQTSCSNYRQSKRSHITNYIEKLLTTVKIEGAEEMSKTK